MWRVCASLQKREASAEQRQRSEACGIQEPHATLSVLHVSVKRMSQRGYGSVLAPFTRWSVQVGKTAFSMHKV